VGQAGTGSSGDRSRRRHTQGGQWQSRVSLRYRHLAWQAITQTTQPRASQWLVGRRYVSETSMALVLAGATDPDPAPEEVLELTAS
jgi:hypothetical protein